jgi:hypothetical protein
MPFAVPCRIKPTLDSPETTSRLSPKIIDQIDVGKKAKKVLHEVLH